MIFYIHPPGYVWSAVSGPERCECGHKRDDHPYQSCCAEIGFDFLCDCKVFKEESAK